MDVLSRRPVAQLCQYQYQYHHYHLHCWEVIHHVIVYCCPQYLKNIALQFTYFVFRHILNLDDPFPSLGRVRGLRGSPLPSLGTRLAFWFRTWDHDYRHSHTASTVVYCNSCCSNFRQTLFATYILKLSMTKIRYCTFEGKTPIHFSGIKSVFIPPDRFHLYHLISHHRRAAS